MSVIDLDNSITHSYLDLYETLHKETPKILLIDLVDNSITDKNTTHSYLDLYQTLLHNKKETAKNVLEIGVCSGGSIKLWGDFFTNATIYGLDAIDINNPMISPTIINKKNIYLYCNTDAYNENVFNHFFKSKDMKFDFMLDDGPHSLESMRQFIILYSQIMTDDGILIIEDVQDWSWIEILTNTVPDNLKQYVKTYDLRLNKNRYDDIVFTIDKTIRNN